MAADDKKDDDQTEEYVMVGDGVEEGDQKVAPVDDKKGGEDDDDDDDDELAAGDKRVGGGEAEDDEKAASRRVENKSRRARQKEARERDQTELKFLRSRNEQVEKQIGELARRQNSSEKQQIDARIAQLENAIKSADDVYGKAISAGEGDDAKEAMQIRDNLKEQLGGWKAYKVQQTDPQTEQSVDPLLVENVKNWHDKNKWFDFGRRDEDSQIAGIIDDNMVRDGWDPRDPKYFVEFSKRIDSRLPHLAKKGKRNGADRDQDFDDKDDKDDDRGDDRGSQRRVGGPRFRVGGRERTLKSNEVHITRERKEAMQEAGMWDDPVLRKKQLARYAEWDKEHANQA